MSVCRRSSIFRAAQRALCIVFCLISSLLLLASGTLWIRSSFFVDHIVIKERLAVTTFFISANGFFGVRRVRDVDLGFTFRQWLPLSSRPVRSQIETNWNTSSLKDAQWVAGSMPPLYTWERNVRRITGGGSLHTFLVTLPYWPFVVVGTLGTLSPILSWIRRRWRFRSGQCASCAYDLTGNTSGRCPECGTPTSAPVAP